MPTLVIADLSSTTLNGTGTFDVLMRANKAHLEEQFKAGRIKGAEYATVYLGSLEVVMRTALEFLVQAKQLELVSQQVVNLQAQLLNIPKEGLVLDGQKCKLDAEFDLLGVEKLKATSENALLIQKGLTEKAQITALGVDDDSVIGKQKALYTAQTAGFARDAEQKAAKLLTDTWNVRRTTDEATVADGVNLLSDATIGRAVTKMLAGVGA